MRRRIPLFLLVLCAACGTQPMGISDAIALSVPPPTSTTQPPVAVNNYDSLIAALRSNAIEPTVQDDIPHPYFSVRGKLVTVGTQRLQAFEYSDAASAEAEAARFSDDGAWHEQNGTQTLVNWIATPHLYRSGKLVVVYLGNDRTLLELLENALGREFAGGANPYAVAMQRVP